MQLERSSREIDGTVYEVACMPAPKALRLKTRLLKITLPALGGAFNGAGSLAALLRAELDLERALTTLCAALTEEQVEDTFRQLLSSDFVMLQGGSKLNWETHFNGKIMTMYKVAAFVLEVNYQDFFDGCKDALSSWVAKIEQKEPDQA